MPIFLFWLLVDASRWSVALNKPTSMLILFFFWDHVCGTVAWAQEDKQNLNSFKAVPMESTKYAHLRYNYHTLMTMFLADIQET